MNNCLYAGRADYIGGIVILEAEISVCGVSVEK